ncbi:MAG TPA: DMT family transporter [Acidisphaera sp.]|nr:DMT family transporter [Acidisphaera sp.]
MAIILGLTAALFWGATDVLGRIGSRHVGVARAMLYGQMPAVVLLTIYLAAAPVRLPHDAPALAWIAGIGSSQVLLAGTYALFRGLSTGRLIVVSPVTASYGAVTALLADVSGETIGLLGWTGIAVTVAGVALMAVPPRGAQHAGRTHSGLGWALAASLGYGFGFWLQGALAVPSLGAVLPVWLYYVSGVPTLLLLFGRGSLTLPPAGTRAILTGIGVLGVVAYVAFSAGLATGAVAVVTVLSSLASGVAVLIARVALDEKVAPHQWGGLVVILGGLACLGAAR